MKNTHRIESPHISIFEETLNFFNDWLRISLAIEKKTTKIAIKEFCAQELREFQELFYKFKNYSTTFLYFDYPYYNTIWFKSSNFE